MTRFHQAEQPFTPEGEPPGQPPRSSRFFSAASLKGRPVPPRDWLVHGRIPMRNVTILGGDGGAGKSLLAHQLAVGTVADCGWLGMPVRQGRAIYLSAEDDEEELHRRTDDILQATGRTYDDIAGLTMRSLAGEDALLAVETGLALIQSELFRELEARAADEGPGLVLLDTAADMYPANENDRAKVRQFIGLLRGLAIRQRCAVVLLSHPSLSGLGSGTGSSGSTAWNNSVRSRLYLSRVIQDGYEPDPDKRSLSVKKLNYGRIGDEIGMTWQNGVFVPDAAPQGLDRLAAGAKAERVFLKLLDEFTAQGRHVSHNPGVTYAPARFAKQERAEGVTRQALEAAMNALFSRGVIGVGVHGRASKERSHIVRKGGGEQVG